MNDELKNPFVSICIPTYNGIEFLEQCLESCIQQDFQDYEIIISDDRSTDSTLKMIEGFQSKSNKIKLFAQPENLGLVRNWNKCLELARGKWIKFVFQDDYISKDCLSKFVKAIEKETVLIVSERNFILPENATNDVQYYYNNRVKTLVNTAKHDSHLYPSMLISKLAVQNMSMNFIAEPSLSFFKKDVINKIGLFNPALKQICDLEFLLRLGSNFGLKYIPEKLCSFRIHANTTTSTNIEEKYFELKYIEPLLFSWFLLYDKNFQNLRNNLDILGLLKLKLYFRVKAYNAYNMDKKEVHNHYLFNENNIDFKEINEVKKGNSVVRAIARMLN